MLKNASLVLFSVCIFCMHKYACTLQLPQEFETCSLSDNNSEECLKRSVEGALLSLKNGNNQLGIQPLDPLIVDEFEEARQPGAISISQKYTHLRSRGFSKCKVLKFDVNLDKCNIFLEGQLPDYRFDANYEYKGVIFTVPVDAKGNFTYTTENPSITYNLTCKISKKDDVEYISIVDSLFQTFPNPKYTQVHFTNLIPGDDERNEQLNTMLNTIPETVEVLTPIGAKMITQAVHKIANDFFSKVPLSEIFKD